MSSYAYRPLAVAAHAIRLLRLLPNPDEAADIYCEVFEYSLEGFHLYRYDALSYVWGDPDVTLPVSIDGHCFGVTTNLHAALLRLRHHSFPRLLWIDAICINQEDHTEKEQQIQYMTTIYSQASCVIVWLGEAADDSDLACDRIRNAASQTHKDTSDSDSAKWAECKLLQRTWFRRIWVLQEVAAARDVVIVCGKQVIDGKTFCLGVQTDTEIGSSAQSMGYIRPVCQLLKRSLPATHYWKPVPVELNLRIGSMRNLVELYFTHEATKCHDKVYALLGMCSDDLDKAGLSPDYQLPWHQLLKRLLKHIFSQNIRIETRPGRQVAVIRSKGRCLARVTKVGTSLAAGDQYRIFANFPNLASFAGQSHDVVINLDIESSPFRVEQGDLICLLQGSSDCTIVRPYRDYLQIVKNSLELPRRADQLLEPEALSEISCEQELLLVWDGEVSAEFRGSNPTSPILSIKDVLEFTGPSPIDDYESWTRRKDWASTQPQLCSQKHIDRASRTLNVVLLLENIAEIDKGGYDAEKYFDEEVVTRYEAAITDYEIGKNAKDLIDRAGDDLCLTLRRLASYSRGERFQEILLSKAARGGHDSLVKLLLETGQIDVNVPSEAWPTWKRMVEETPLLAASRGGHEDVVRRLLDVDGIDVSKGNPLLLATQNGHEAVAKLLLQTGSVDVNAWTFYRGIFDFSRGDGATPLWWAAKLGHEPLVKLFLDRPDIQADVKVANTNEPTPFFAAARYGHVAVVRLLLETEQINIDYKNRWDETPLSTAANHGYEAVVSLLLGTGRVDVNNNADGGDTPLSHAARAGHESVVRLLLETGTVDTDSPLQKAVMHGHAAVVKLLLDEEKTDVNLATSEGDTLLHLAASYSSVEEARMLLSTGQGDVRRRNRRGETPLDVAKDPIIIQLLRDAGHGKTSLAVR